MGKYLKHISIYLKIFLHFDLILLPLQFFVFFAVFFKEDLERLREPDGRLRVENQNKRQRPVIKLALLKGTCLQDSNVQHKGKNYQRFQTINEELNNQSFCRRKRMEFFASFSANVRKPNAQDDGERTIMTRTTPPMLALEDQGYQRLKHEAFFYLCVPKQ